MKNSLFTLKYHIKPSSTVWWNVIWLIWKMYRPGVLTRQQYTWDVNRRAIFKVSFVSRWPNVPSVLSVMMWACNHIWLLDRWHQMWWQLSHLFSINAHKKEQKLSEKDITRRFTVIFWRLPKGFSFLPAATNQSQSNSTEMRCTTHTVKHTLKKRLMWNSLLSYYWCQSMKQRCKCIVQRGFVNKKK